MEQPTYRKKCVPQTYDAGAQIKFLASRATAEGPLACQNSKALTLRMPPSSSLAMYVSSWKDTESITSNDDIDTWTMEEAENLNVCRNDGGGAPEQWTSTQNSVNAEAGLKFFSVNLRWNGLHEN